MKQRFIVLLAILIVFSCMPTNTLFTSAIDETQKEETTFFSSEYEFLNKIGVLPDKFDLSASTKRGEYAYLIGRILYENVTYSEIVEEKMFLDVDTGNQYYNEIKVLKSLNVISGDLENRFYPDNEIDYKDAVTILIKALSYSHYAQAKGGYPSGYLYTANQLGLSKGIKDLTGFLNGNTVVKLVYNSLFVDSVNIDAISDGEVSYSINTGKNVLSEYLGIEEHDAIIVNDQISSFDGAELIGDKKVLVRDYVANKETILYATDNGIFDYFGCRMKLFTKENEKFENEIIYYELNSKATKTDVLGNHIISVSDTTIEYELDENSAKYNKFALDKTNPPMVFFNGVRRIDYTTSDLMNENLLISFIDHDNDNKINVILVYDFGFNVVVSNINEEYITDKSEFGHNLDLDSDETKYRIIKSGKVKELKDIRTNDIISVAKSQRKVDEKSLYYLMVTRDQVSGELESKGEAEITIEGKSYKVTKEILIDLQKLEYVNMKGCLDCFGRIAYIEKSESTKKYAFVLQAGVTGNVIEQTGIVKLFTKEGNVETFNLSDKVKMNDETGTADLNTLVEKLKETTEDLIVYSLNSDGEIDKIQFAQDFDSNEKNNQERFVYVKTVTARSAYSGHSFGGMNVKEAICFNINSAYDSTGKGCEIFALKTNQYYGGLKFYDLKYDGTVGAVLMKGNSSTGSFSTEPKEVYLFEKMTDCVTKDGELYKKIYYYNRGERGSIIADPEATHLELADYKCESILNLKFGDIFTYETNLSGYLGSFCLLYDSSIETPDSDGSIYQSTWGGTGTAKDITLLQGTLRYKSADKIVISLNGTSLVLHPLYRSGNDKACIVNRTTKKIKVISLDELKAMDFYNNIQGDSIITQSTRHQLKEVILYE